MKSLRIVALFLFLTAPAFAEPEATAHWYEVTTSGSQQPTRFVGSSELEPDQVAAKIDAGETIVLENIRSVFAQPDKGVTMGWNPDTSVLKLYLPGRSVLYFAVLAKDPADRGVEHEGGADQAKP